MKKIITSLGMIVFVGAIVAGGTGAFFSDTETSTGNIFTAGSLDLRVDSVAHINGLVCHNDGQGNRWIPNNQVVWNPETQSNELIQGADVSAAIVQYNNENPANVPKAGDECGGTWSLTDLGVGHRFFDYGDLKPGDSGENTISLHVFDNDAYMCAIVHNVKSNENGCTAPEIAAGDTTCNNPGEGEGELHQEIRFFIWEDDGDNIYQQGETILVENATAEEAGGVYPLYTPETGVFPGDETKYLGVYWCYGEFELNGTELSCDGALVTNMTQTDSLEADISFYIEQARHNDGFTCPTLESFEGEDIQPTPFTLFHNADSDNEPEDGQTIKPVRVASLGGHNGSLHAIGDLFTVEEVYGESEKFTLKINNGDGNYEFVVTTPFAVSGSDKSMAILIDTDNDGFADFQFEYTNNSFQYKERNNGGFSNQATPVGYSAVESGGQQVFTFTLPKADLDAIFKVGVNATHNNSPKAGTHLQMGIPVRDIFDGGNWTSSANYLLVDTN